MLILYNVLQLLLLILLFPLLTIYIALRPKYRNRIPKRLGKNLKKQLSSHPRKIKTVWIHALSVGEVTSAIPLVAKMQEELKDISIIFSASTKTGNELAEKTIAKYCDHIIAFPLDLLPVVNYFITLIKPNVFILVETDFWPNILNQLQKRKIPSILVNGRISKKSFKDYKRYAFFFKPMFLCFSQCCVQTESDKNRFIEIGVAKEKILKLGNLKYEPVKNTGKTQAAKIICNCKGLIIVAGSTHPGEEEMLCTVFKELKEKKNPHLNMIIAPRKIERGGDIVHLASKMNLNAQLRSSQQTFTSEILVLDTIGELLSFYGIADLCFVGGSLVNEGGHNPIEPASQGKPVVFGQYMDDFEEVSEELIQSGGGFSARNIIELTTLLDKLLSSSQYRLQCGIAARNCVTEKEGLLEKHIELIRDII